MDLHASRQLRMIGGLGQRHISEIEAALAFAGLDLDGQQPANEEEPAR